MHSFNTILIRVGVYRLAVDTDQIHRIYSGEAPETVENQPYFHLGQLFRVPDNEYRDEMVDILPSCADRRRSRARA